MADAGKVLVTGATGNVGSGLVPALKQAGVDVRALVHEEVKAQPLRDLGVEVVLGDLEDPKTSETAVAGVDKIYLLVTNGPTAKDQATNVIRAAARAGSPTVVRHGMYGPPQSRIAEQHDVIDRELKSSGLTHTTLRPTFFMQNALMSGPTVASDGMIYWPWKDGKVGMIDVRDIVDVAFTVLTEDGHEGNEYILTGPQSISYHDVAAGLSKVLGKEVTYVSVPIEAARESMVGMGFPGWTTDGYLELMAGFADNWGDRVSPDVEKITGSPGRSFEQFARDFVEVFGGQPAVVAS